MSYQAPIELYTIIEDVVDSIRETGDITAFSESNGVYTITSDNSLGENDYITIDSVQYYVTNVTDTGFTITGSTGLDFTNAQWKANAPYFMCEKEAKAAQILTEKTKQDTYKWQKYPLFLLVRPYTDDRTNRMIGYTVDFNLYIITNTDQNYWNDDRIDNNFDPILYPLYNSFMDALPHNRWVGEKKREKIAHTKTDLMFIDANPFPDKMDGLNIGFTDFVVKRNKQICEPETAVRYEIDLSSTTGGTATSSLGGEGSYTVDKNTNVAFNAAPDTGYRFRYWLLNNIQNITNPLALIITKNYNIVADFIKTWVLTISAYGNGTVTPESGTYDDQEQITLEATPNDVDTQFDRWESTKLGTVTDNPLDYTVTQDDTIIGYFTALLQTIQDVFGTSPFQTNKKWYFPNAIAGDNVQCQINTGQSNSVYLADNTGMRTTVNPDIKSNIYPKDIYAFQNQVTLNSNLGGQPISEWLAPDGQQWKELKEQIETYINWCVGVNRTPTFKRLLWLQFENDIVQGIADEYEPKLRQVIADVRAINSIYTSNIPFLLFLPSNNNGQDETQKGYITTAMNNVAADTPNVYTVNTDDLDFSDGVHYANYEYQDLLDRADAIIAPPEIDLGYNNYEVLIKNTPFALFNGTDNEMLYLMARITT